MFDKILAYLGMFLNAADALYKAFDKIKGYFKNKEWKQ